MGGASHHVLAPNEPRAAAYLNPDRDEMFLRELAESMRKHEANGTLHELLATARTSDTDSSTPRRPKETVPEEEAIPFSQSCRQDPNYGALEEGRPVLMEETPGFSWDCCKRCLCPRRSNGAVRRFSRRSAIQPVLLKK